MNLEGKTIVVTGGRRVGQVVARELARQKALILMTYLDSPAEVAPVLDEVRAAGGSGHSLQLDLRDEQSVTAFTARLEHDFPQIDALINMAAVFIPDRQKIQYANIVDLFSINAFGAMVISRWFAERAKKRQAVLAPIVSFIDWAIDHPYAGHDFYLASKAALRHYLMALQTSFAGSVRVVNIHPGMILEPEGFPAKEKKEIIANTPLKAIGDPGQVAVLVRTALELDFWADNVMFAGGQQWRHRL